jgi:hypothetical protein
LLVVFLFSILVEESLSPSQIDFGYVWIRVKVYLANILVISKNLVLPLTHITFR